MSDIDLRIFQPQNIIHYDFVTFFFLYLIIYTFRINLFLFVYDSYANKLLYNSILIKDQHYFYLF